MRVVIELKRDANAEIVLNNLYKFSRLQENISVNMIALVNGEPKILNLKQMLEHYLSFQEEVIIRKTRFDMDKAKKRAHILQGLMLAADCIDEVISIIRSCKNIPEAKDALTKRFKDTDMTALMKRALEHYELTFSAETTEYGLSKEQVDAIIAMTFGQLTGLEREKTAGELAELIKKIREFEAILSDRTKVLEIISQGLREIKQKYGDKRRTAVELVDGEVDNEDLIPVEECVLTYTSIGYIKRQAANAYSTQGRGGKGVSSMKQRDEDFVQDMITASTHDNILFVTNSGNMFRLKGFEIPSGSRQSRGTNIVNLIALSENERAAVMLKTDDFSENKYFVCVTKQGIIKRTALSEFKNLRKHSLRAITLNDGDEIASAHITEGDSFVLIATRTGRCIYFNEKEIRPTGRSSHGVRAIRLKDNDFVVGAVKVYEENTTILTVSEKGLGRRTHISKYRKQSRGGYGTINYRTNEKTGLVCNICSLPGDDDVILISNDGIMIRIYAATLSLYSRYSRGVKLMRLSENQTIVNFTRTEHDDNAEIETVEDETADDDDLESAEIAENMENSEQNFSNEIDDDNNDGNDGNAENTDATDGE
jgi:DNA gyrase subunit A